MDGWNAASTNLEPNSKPVLNPLTSRQRNVAQQRRRMETEEFQKLGAVLPISRAISEQHIDKTTIVRLAASYIQLHHLLNFRPDGSELPFDSGSATSSLIDIIDGFLVVLSDSGDILYVSETISLHLGLSQVEMIGNPFSTYFHPMDVENFQKFLKTLLYSKGSSMETFRVKSTLTKRTSKDLHNPNAGYRALQITMTTCSQISTGSLYLAGYCHPHLVGAGVTLRLGNHSFIVTTDLALNIIYIDPHISSIFERVQTYPSETHPSGRVWRKGVSLYSVVAPDDAYLLQEIHQNLFKFHSFKSPVVQLIAEDSLTTFHVEVFAISYSPANAHGNSQKAIGDHFVFICTYIG